MVISNSIWENLNLFEESLKLHFFGWLFFYCIEDAQGLVSSGKVQRFYRKERMIATELFYATLLSAPAFSWAYLSAIKTCSPKWAVEKSWKEPFLWISNQSALYVGSLQNSPWRSFKVETLLLEDGSTIDSFV